MSWFIDFSHFSEHIQKSYLETTRDRDLIYGMDITVGDLYSKLPIYLEFVNMMKDGDLQFQVEDTYCPMLNYTHMYTHNIICM